jgi:thioredoxin reductase (NADPH)
MSWGFWGTRQMNDVAIIGAGPAGISAAIYMKRAGFEPLVIERDEVGGLLLNANLVENLPGFSPGVSGESLVNLFAKHLEDNGIKVTKTEVIKVDFDGESYTIHTRNSNFTARSLILATGTTPVDIGINGSENLIGKRIFFEIKSLPSPREGIRVAIVGSGDGAFDYALNLADDDCDVQIFMRSDKPKCLKLLEERVQKNSKIEVMANAGVVSTIEKDSVLVLNIEQGEETKEFKADYLLIACGRKPNLTLIQDILRENNNDMDSLSKIPGLFMAGDVRHGDHRQAGIAIGDGINAAMSAVSYLNKEGVNEDSR